MDTSLRLSRWSFIFQRDECDDIALYNSIDIVVVFLEKRFNEIIDLLKIGTTLGFILQKHKNFNNKVLKNIIEELVSMEFIVKTNSNEMFMLDKKRKQYISPAGIETLYLMLTDQCNLKCLYCFINNSMPQDYKCTSMSWSVAKKAIDMFFLNLSKNPPEYDNSIKMIFFYGGEPFLNFGLIKKSVEYVEDKYRKEIGLLGSNFRFSIITNGTLVNKEIAIFLSQHKNIAIGISLDGEKSINDERRQYCNGKGSFEKIMAGYSLLKETGCNNISISCTVDEHNIDKLSSLLRLHKDYEFIAINLNLLLDTGKNTVNQSYMTRASKEILKYFEDARKIGVYEDRVMRKLKAFISHSIHPFDCQATGNQIVCSPDGQLSVCHEGIGAKNFFFADVSNKFDFHNNPIVKEWNNRTPLNMPQCFDCPALGICGGGCAYGACMKNGSIWSIDDRFCIHSLSTLEWMIWDVYKTF